MDLISVAALLVVVSFALGAILSGQARRWGPRVGLVDRPGGHKGHKAPTPLGGGVAIWSTTGLVLGLGALLLEAGFGAKLLPEGLAGGLWEKAGTFAAIFGLATLIMLMGLADDRFGLGWPPRLAIQVGLALVAVLGVGLRMTLFPPFSNAVLTTSLTVFWIVGLTNAFNFLDNMDGLAAGVGLIAALLFAGAQVLVGSLFVPAAMLVLAGALGGFLVENRHPARLFMGDAGSNFLGFFLGCLTVAGTFTTERYSPYSVLTPLLVMAVPLYDTISVVLIRLREGRSPFRGDRRHLSHRLVARGLTPPAAVRTIDLVTLAGGLGALLLHRVDGLGACVVVAQTICLLGVVALLEISTTRPERPHGEANSAATT